MAPAAGSPTASGGSAEVWTCLPDNQKKTEYRMVDVHGHRVEGVLELRANGARNVMGAGAAKGKLPAAPGDYKVGRLRSCAASILPRGGRA